MRQRTLFVVLGTAVIALAIGATLFVGCSAPRPTNLGASAGRLTPCPDSPNCVASQAERSSEHFVEPLTFTGDAATAWRNAKEAALALPGARLVEGRDDYAWIEVTTRVLRFVDDLELVLRADAKRIDVRSSSRIGYSDLGTNRRRIEALRAEFRRRESSAAR